MNDTSDLVANFIAACGILGPNITEWDNINPMKRAYMDHASRMGTCYDYIYKVARHATRKNRGLITGAAYELLRHWDTLEVGEMYAEIAGRSAYGYLVDNNELNTR